MSLMSMSFGDFTWEINPTELTVEYENTLVERILPFYGTNVENIGRKSRTVKGVGYFVGEDALEKFDLLEEVFFGGENAVLTLPNKMPFVAVFKSLGMVGVTQENVVKYTFTFVEVQGDEKNFVPAMVTAKEGESLLKYANMYAVPIETMVEKNRHIRYINWLDEGEVIYT